jgi:hypothetical protein
MASGTSRELNAVWAASSDDAFAVGAEGTILRFDGRDWDPMFSGTAADLHGVWGTSGNHVIATGDQGTILVFDGGAWDPVTGVTTDPIGSVTGIDANNLVAVGGGPPGSFLVFDGVEWTVRSTGDSQTLADALMIPPGGGSLLVGAAGTMFVAGPDTVTAIATGTTSNLNAILGTTAEDVIAVGDDGTVLAINFDAFPPDVREISGTSTDLTGITMRGYNDLFLLGSGGSILAFDRCSTQPSKGSGALLNDIAAVSSERVLAVGADGTILTYTGPGPAACPDQVTVSVSGGLTPTFSWSPNCFVNLVLVEEQAGDMWVVEGDGNLIESGVRYGDHHPCETGFWYEGPLLPGVEYDVILFRYDEAVDDYTLIALETFTP